MSKPWKGRWTYGSMQIDANRTSRSPPPAGRPPADHPSMEDNTRRGEKTAPGIAGAQSCLASPVMIDAMHSTCQAAGTSRVAD